MGRTNLYFILLNMLSVLTFACTDNEMEIDDQGPIESDRPADKVNIDKCNNFHGLVCENWADRYKRPDDIGPGKWNVKEIVKLTLLTKIKEILDQPILEGDNRKLSIEKRWYRACMDTEESIRRGRKILDRILRTSGREYFSLEATETEKSWHRVAEYFADEYGEMFLFDIEIDTNNFLHIGRPKRRIANTIPIESLEDETGYNLIKYLIAFTEFQESSNTDITKSINELTTFMKFIEKVPNNGKQTIILKDLLNDEKYSCHGQINWDKLLKTLIKGNFREHKKFANSIKIYIDTTFLEDLCRLLLISPSRAIVNYMHYTFAMNKDMYFYAFNTNELSERRRSIECINRMPFREGYNSRIRGTLPNDIETYIKKYIFEPLREELVHEIQSGCLQDAVNETLLIKASEMEFEARDLYKYTKPFKILYLKNDKIGQVAVQNYLNYRILQNNLKIDIDLGPAINVNAELIYRHNKIGIFAGMLFEPFFDTEALWPYKFGILGFEIAREMARSVYMYLISQYTPLQIRTKATDNIECFRKQYNAYRVHGEVTLPENVVDSFGLKLAFKGFNRFINEHPSLINVNQKEKELNEFFSSFAKHFCENPQMEDYVQGSIFSPNRIRVNGALSNLKEFSDLNRCPKGSFMNRGNRCDLLAKPEDSQEQKLEEQEDIDQEDIDLLLQRLSEQEHMDHEHMDQEDMDLLLQRLSEQEHMDHEHMDQEDMDLLLQRLSEQPEAWN